MNTPPLVRTAMLALPILALPARSEAHGIVGDRFFPATIATDDPFAADELALPTITVFNREADVDAEYSKTILPGFALSFGVSYVQTTPQDGPSEHGFDNLAISPLIEMWRNDDHEAIVSAGLVWDIGGTGMRRVADSASSYTPEILFGKGFGDLPDTYAVFRPLALTGQLGWTFSGASSNAVQWGGALEYSFLYLQNNVRDQGFSTFVEHLTPLVEVALSTSADRGLEGTAGTINPGIVWSGQYAQLALEAVVPANRASGDGVGYRLQFHLYLDDLLPGTLGLPILGGGP